MLVQRGNRLDALEIPLVVVQVSRHDQVAQPRKTDHVPVAQGIALIEPRAGVEEVDEVVGHAGALGACDNSNAIIPWGLRENAHSCKP